MDGTYTITLTVTDADGLTDTDAQQVTVAGQPPQDNPPVASFNVVMDWMVANVTSTSTDDKGIVSTAWDFGDGATAMGLTASHKYATPGMWTITLTVTDTIGQTGTTSKQVEAKLALPIATFTSLVNKRDVSVDASGSYDPDGGPIASWSWNWGDGSALGSGGVATHRYASIGTFTITLTVTDDDGQTATMSKQVTTTDSPPVASFTVSVSGLVVNVDASASSDDYAVVSWSWNWGDGTTGTGKTATHTYPATKPAPSMAPAAVNGKVPPPPVLVFGQTKDQAGNVVPDCTIMITNMRTGAVNYTVSDTAYGYYEFNLNDQIGGVANGDMIKVTATKGAMSGEATAAYDSAVGFVYLDVVLKGSTPLPYDVTITLTVADELGQTASVSKVVTVTP
jgi:PKD repeat protein